MDTVSEHITADALWKVEAYRLALYASDLGWRDVTKLLQDKRTIGLANQLFEALGSIGANLSEGYSRGSGRDRARFYEYSLGSGRESRTWYFGGRHVLSEAVSAHRIELLTHIVRLLLVMVPDQRAMPAFHEQPAEYLIRDSESGNNPGPNASLTNFLGQPVPVS